MKRTGRKGHAQYRVVVQDSHQHPTSGKVVSYLGSYDPHAKKAQLNKEKVEKFLTNGAQPSNRIAIILNNEGIQLPKWVNIDQTGQGKLRNPDKLRKNQPKEEPVAEAPAEATEATQTTETASEEPAAEDTTAKDEAEAPAESEEGEAKA